MVSSLLQEVCRALEGGHSGVWAGIRAGVLAFGCSGRRLGGQSGRRVGRWLVGWAGRQVGEWSLGCLFARVNKYSDNNCFVNFYKRFVSHVKIIA